MTAEHHKWQDHQGPIAAEREGKQVIACERCGYRHVVPLPDPVELRRLYEEEFYGEIHQDYIARQEGDLPWWELEFGAKFALFEELLPPDRRTLLDVGSGPGWFLAFADRRGWWGKGVEPSRQACEHATDKLGLDVVRGFFDPETAADLEPVDVVHLHNVLEHIPDPGPLLETAASVLAPGGLISVTVPNDFNPLQEALVKLRGHDRWWVVPGEHLNYFDRDSLAGLLTRCGFTVRRHLASFPLELFALMGEDYLADPSLGRAIHGKRMNLEHALVDAGRADLLGELYGRLGEMGLGRTLTVVAELEMTEVR